MTEQLAYFDAEQDFEGDDRRHSPRRAESIPYSIPLTPSPAEGETTGDAPKIVGHTRDLSARGLALIVPSLTFAYRRLLSPDFKLRLTLELPSGPVEIEGTPTHDRPLRESDSDMHYMLSGELDAESGALFYGYEDNPTGSACILGVRITGMSEEHRARYEKHLGVAGAAVPAGVSGARPAGTATKSAGAFAAPRKTAVDFWRSSNAASGYSYF